jgi:hypothetical protein
MVGSPPDGLSTALGVENSIAQETQLCAINLIRE